MKPRGGLEICTQEWSEIIRSWVERCPSTVSSSLFESLRWSRIIFQYCNRTKYKRLKMRVITRYFGLNSKYFHLVPENDLKITQNGKYAGRISESPTNLKYIVDEYIEEPVQIKIAGAEKQHKRAQGPFLPPMRKLLSSTNNHNNFTLQTVLLSQYGIILPSILTPKRRYTPGQQTSWPPQRLLPPPLPPLRRPARPNTSTSPPSSALLSASPFSP